MLGKLLKHEWIATARRYALLYLVLAASTLFAAVIHALPIEHSLFRIGETAVLVVYVISLFGVALFSSILYIVRFYKNMVSDEGYLTFTLPARVEHLVLAKFIVAFTWEIITVVSIFLSLACVFMLGHVELGAVADVFGSLGEMFGSLLYVFLLVLFVSAIYKMLLYYLSIAIGQMFGNYKILASVIAYFAVSFAIGLVVMIIMLVVCSIIGFVEVGNIMSTMDGMTKFYGISAAIMAGIAIGEFFAVCQLLKKKLNLV